MTRPLMALAVVVALSLPPAACSSSHPVPQPSPVARTLAGGCAGTQLTDALPPSWAQAGWSATAAPWPVPWALASTGDAVAYVFAGQLVAQPSPRADGTNNKILWVARGDQGGFIVDGRPRGQPRPVVSVAGGPSIVDLPSPGCWTFTLQWAGHPSSLSPTVNLQVLPAGTLPPKTSSA